jgi:hypothetical protein
VRSLDVLSSPSQLTSTDDVVSLSNGPASSGGVFEVSKADDAPLEYTYKVRHWSACLAGVLMEDGQYDEVKVLSCRRSVMRC